MELPENWTGTSGHVLTELDQLLNLRFELLAASQLARAGALTRIRKDTPDFECRWGSHEFGVEVTTRAREEVAAALHNAMDRGLWDGPDVNVVLERTTGTLKRGYLESLDEVTITIQDEKGRDHWRYGLPDGFKEEAGTFDCHYGGIRCRILRCGTNRRGRSCDIASQLCGTRLGLPYRSPR